MDDVALGRLYFWRARALYLGPGVAATVHAHHALQVCIPLSGLVRLRPGANSPWREYRGAVIPSNEPHESDVAVDLVSSLWIEPGGEIPRASLPRREQSPILAIDDAALNVIVPRLHECWEHDFAADRASVLVDDILQRLAPHQPRTPVDPRVTRAFQILDSAPEHRIPWKQVATAVHLSPGRLAHLFTATTGIPARRYLLWLRLRDAVDSLAAGATSTEAAYAAGFADAAHLARTFRRMLGFAPSSFLRLRSGFRPVGAPEQPEGTRESNGDRPIPRSRTQPVPSRNRSPYTRAVRRRPIG
jgi:AraC-like DNA-binding protein